MMGDRYYDVISVSTSLSLFANIANQIMAFAIEDSARNDFHNSTRQRAKTPTASCFEDTTANYLQILPLLLDSLQSKARKRCSLQILKILLLFISSLSDADVRGWATVGKVGSCRVCVGVQGVVA
jgi:hypothetical protein